MLCQIFSALLGRGLQTLTQDILPAVGSAALNIGTQFTSQLVTRELNRSADRARDDALKAALRAAANAVSPTAAPGQTAVFSGGPATGSAFLPATVLPPSIVSPAQILQTDPNFSTVFPGTGAVTTSFGQPVRSGIVSVSPTNQTLLAGLPGGPGVQPQPVFFGAAAKAAIKFGQRIRKGASAFDPRSPIGRRMLGVAAGGAAVQTGAMALTDAIFSPGTAFAPTGPGGFPQSGNPLRIGGDVAVQQTDFIPTGLPARGRFVRDASGCQVQWFLFDPVNMTQTPITREQARECVKKECIFRQDAFTGGFVKLKSRRMNPMNVRAFFRAGRRVDAGERICRKMFSEKRKQKTGTVRRKSRSKAKR